MVEGSEDTGKIISKIIVGYLSGIDVASPIAVRSGLTKRRTLILNSYRLGLDSAFFDPRFYIQLLQFLQSLMSAERIWASNDNHRPSEYAGVEFFAQDWLKEDDEEPRPRDWILLEKNDKNVALIEGLLCNVVGGPDPYNDNIALAIYTAEGAGGNIDNELLGFCGKYGARFDHAIEGGPVPSIGFITRIRMLLRI